MSKVCPKHQAEMTAKELGGVMNYFCPECGREAMAAFMPPAMVAASERNCRVQARYDELAHLGKHGHYETMFQVVREEVERASADLLAALEAFPDEPNPYTYRLAHKKARAAIAKATNQPEMTK